MLWLYARFPQLPLEVFDAAASEQPAAVCEKQEVLQGNAAARRAGLRPGQSAATARNLCPDIRLLPRDSDREAQRLQQLALWAYRFTPEVCLEPSRGLLLEISGSLRLFKGLGRLGRAFEQGLTRRGARVRFGLGHTPLCARLLSHNRQPLTRLADSRGLDLPRVQQRLDTLPLALLPTEQKHIERCRAMGLNTLGELLALPPASLNRRFGKHFSELLARITGARPDPRARFVPPDIFRAERQFNGGLNSKEQLRFPMAAMLQDLEHYLRLRQCVCRELHWQFEYCDGQSDWLTMPVSHRQFKRRALLELVNLRLEKQALRGNVEYLRLQSRRFEALDMPAGDLFGSGADRQQALAELVDKLQARLGPDCCYGLALQAKHLPELAWKAIPALSTSPTQTAPQPALRPPRLLSRPLPLAQREGQLFYRGAIQLLQGPERVDQQWWQQRQCRDYYIARHDSGGLCWLFRDCLRGGWYLHGWFS